MGEPATPISSSGSASLGGSAPRDRRTYLPAGLVACLVVALGASCSSLGPGPPAARPGDPERVRTGRMLVGGEEIAVGVEILGPRDRGGFDATLERCVFHPDRVLPAAAGPGCDVARRYGERSTDGLGDGVAARIAARGFDRAAAEARIDLVVLHYDAAGTSRRCFEVLHDERGLSCHLLLDVDGTVRQTLDLALRARHATVANDRSVGIEIAHVGAYPSEASFEPLYSRGPDGMTLTIPARLFPPPGGPFRVARGSFVEGTLNGRRVVQPDFTEAQYESLGRLLVALRRVLPRVEARVPHDAAGRPRTDALPPAELADFHGVLGHLHVQSDKVDPGPAFDWDRVARSLEETSP